jgi:hypothetical protein
MCISSRSLAFGTHCQRAGNRHALPLAARQFLRITASQTAQTHQLERFGHPFGTRGPLHVAHLETEADIAVDGHMREQRIALEHHAHAALFRPLMRDVAPVERDRAGTRRDEAGDHLQGRGLAATGRPQQLQGRSARSR